MTSSTPSTFASGSVHHGSLVDPALHSPALLRLIDVKLSKQVVGYVVYRVVEAVDFAMGRPKPLSSCSGNPQYAKFSAFVANVLWRAGVTMPTVLATLVYIDRARPRLLIEKEQWALERIFLGALVVASKYLNDSTMKNVHWAMCTRLFGNRDLNRIEREYLNVLDFELKITEYDVLSHYDDLLGAAPPLLPNWTRNSPAHIASLPPDPINHWNIVQNSTSAPIRLNHPPIYAPGLPELSPPSPTPSSDPCSPSSSLATPSISDLCVDFFPVEMTFHSHQCSESTPRPQTGESNHKATLPLSSLGCLEEFAMGS